MNNLPYIEIRYEPSEDFPGKPWIVLQGNLPKEFNGKKYRVYLEEMDDEREGIK